MRKLTILQLGYFFWKKKVRELKKEVHLLRLSKRKMEEDVDEDDEEKEKDGEEIMRKKKRIEKEKIDSNLLLRQKGRVYTP